MSPHDKGADLALTVRLGSAAEFSTDADIEEELMRDLRQARLVGDEAEPLSHAHSCNDPSLEQRVRVLAHRLPADGLNRLLKKPLLPAPSVPTA